MKRERDAIDQGKAIQARFEATKVKVDGLKSKLEVADQVHLGLVDRLKRAQERSSDLEEELKKFREEQP